MGDVAVLGAGLTGLVAAYLLDAELIGPKNPPQPWAPIWLWDSRSSEEFIQQLFGCFDDVPSSRAEICFVYQGELIPHEVGRDRYSRKVYGEPKEDAGCKGKDNFWYIKFPVPVLASVLQSKVPILEDRVVAVDTEKNIVTTENHGKKEYAEIYSTIPLNIMLGLTGYSYLDLGIEKPMYKLLYYEVDYSPPFQIASCFNITYVCDPSPTTRIFDMQNYYVIETTEQTTLGSAPKILNKIDLKKIDDVKLIGRYARWNPDILLHNVIEELMRAR